MKAKSEFASGMLKKFTVARLDKPAGAPASKGKEANPTTSGTTCRFIR